MNRDSMLRLLGLTLACLLLIIFAAKCRGEIIPTTRLMDWGGTTGIPGGIPTVSTIYTNFTTNNNLSQIQGGINNCPSNQVVKLASGTYSLGTLNLNGKPGVVLRGAGMQSTVINATAIPFINISELGHEFKSAEGQALSSGYTKGSTAVVTTAAPSGYLVEQNLCIIWQNDTNFVFNSGGTNASMHLTHRIVSISGNTINIDPPLAWGLSSALSPKIQGLNGGPTDTRMVGIEDLSINAGGTSGNVIAICGGDRVWVKNVLISNWVDVGILFNCSVQGEVRSCRIEGANAWPNQSDGYGVYLWEDSSYCRIEDCIFNKFFYSMWGTRSSGNLRIYNYTTNSAHGGATFQEGSLNTQHGAEVLMCLWEGNVGNQAQTDMYHGSSSLEIFLRNWIHGLDRGIADNRKMIDIGRGCYYYGVVGNVLGHSSWSNNVNLSYELSCNDCGYNVTQTIFRWGYPNVDNNDYDQGNIWPSSYGLEPYPDEQSKATAIVHGNYDTYTDLHDGAGDGITWDGGISDHAVTNSYVYTSKPSYFGILSWPPFDAASPSTANPTNIPAGYRFYFGTNPPAAAGGGTPAPPRGLRKGANVGAFRR